MIGESHGTLSSNIFFQTATDTLRDSFRARLNLPAGRIGAVAAAPTDEARRRLLLLRATQDPAPEPIDLTTKDARVFLSDAWADRLVEK